MYAAFHIDGISIHVPLAGNVLDAEGADFTPEDFYPRSPCGERQVSGSLLPTPPNFYPRSPCGERPFPRGVIRAHFVISIHVPLAGNVGKL